MLGGLQIQVHQTSVREGHRETGWQQDGGVYSPSVPASTTPYVHINVAERQVIENARAARQYFRSIARSLGRSHSSISREWARNSGTEGYYASTAEHHAQERARRRRRADHAPLRTLVFRWLKRD